MSKQAKKKDESNDLDDSKSLSDQNDGTTGSGVPQGENEILLQKVANNIQFALLFLRSWEGSGTEEQKSVLDEYINQAKVDLKSAGYKSDTPDSTDIQPGEQQGVESHNSPLDPENPNAELSQSSSNELQNT